MADIRDATLDDVEQVYELLDRRSRSVFGVSEVSRDFVAASFHRPAADRWVAEDGGRIVGYAHLTSAHELVHAAPDGAIADQLLALAEHRARERSFDAVEATVVPEDDALYALVQRSGFLHERDVLRMWRDLDGDPPESAWPRGLSVRTYTDADGERVHALLDETYLAWDDAYVPLAHDEWLGFMTQHDEFEPALWFVVERDGDLVACALHWKEHQGRGWIKDIVVHERMRGRGIGKALLHHGFLAYRTRGVPRVGLKVDSTNPTGARQLYERTGFAVDRRYGIWRKAL